uniref:G-protein coupled receptors family 1 profile domain-containing protein n=1 Tax=Romanomermis culicivorax TaxID=13658 RepID=A0A915J7X7_ROMCU
MRMMFVDKVQPPLLFLTNFFTVLCNGFLLVYYSKLKKNDSNTDRKSPKIHQLQIILISVDLAYGAASILSSILLHFLPFSTKTTFVCIFIPWPTLYLTVASLFVRLLFNLERIVACGKPVFYKNFRVKRGSQPIYCTVCLGPPLFFSLWAFYGADYQHLPATCSPVVARAPALRPMLSYYICATGAAVVSSVALLMFILKKNRKKISTTDVDRDSGNVDRRITPKNRERVATKLAVSLTIVGVAMDVVPNVALTVLSKLSLVDNDAFGKMVQLLFSLSLCGNLLVFVRCDRSMRKKLKDHLVSFC